LLFNEKDALTVRGAIRIIWGATGKKQMERTELMPK